MPAPELYTHFLERLNATGIRYMITGGLAAIIYGEPRLTNDVDIVIVMGAEDVEVFGHSVPSARLLCDAGGGRTAGGRHSRG
jgi:hypothetical protein